MPSLAPFLASRFRAELPPGWTAEPEARLLPDAYAKRIGYVPHADLLLCAGDGRRVAVELEVSRADPVANPAKVLLAFECGALAPERDAFVTALSPHVQRGRRNLTALFTRHMRQRGLSAFGVSLLPSLAPEEISRLNLLSPEALTGAGLPIRTELARILEVVNPRGQPAHRIHFAGDCTDVMANVWAWNDAMEADRTLSWETRWTQFWVMDPVSGLFAPSKFCAFLPTRGPAGAPPPPTMTPEVYTTLGEEDPAFDGHRARRHLVESLCFRLVPWADHGGAWAAWRGRMGGRIALRGEVRLLLPPSWWG